MRIEIQNYNPNIATKSLLASFDLIFRDWGFVIRECKLFEKEGNKWFVMPNKPVKNSDGTWGNPIPYFEFLGKEMYFKVQKMVIEEIERASPPPTITPMEYYPSGTRKGEYIQADLPLGTCQAKPSSQEQELPF